MAPGPHRVAYYADIVYDHPLSGPYWIPPADLDVEAILLGGDIDYTPERLARMAQEIRENQRPETGIVFVPGNGEYVGLELNETRRQYKEAIGGVNNALFLDDEVAVLPSGLRIIGSTLWSLVADEDLAAYNAGVFKDEGYAGVDNIRLGDRPLTFEDTNALHREAVRFIERELKRLSKAERSRTIVCTHHWPTLQPWADPSAAASEPWRQATGTALDPLIADWGPKLWLCGHSHESKTVVIGDTQVSSNPRTGAGPDNVNPDFVDHYIVELPKLHTAQA